MKFLDETELVRLLRVARNRSARDWCMLLVAYRHAMRASEVSDLRLADLDLKARSIIVRRVKGSLVTTQPLAKLKGQPLLDEPRALTAWLAGRSDPSDYLFTSQKGGKLTPNAVWRVFTTIAGEAGIAGRTLHSLKHTRVTLALQGGMGLADVRQLAGHKSLSSTLRYVHSTDERAGREAARSEANLFNGS
jgi:type 1 fimbriae regulatory protein FimB